jgi:hypothetical protein
LTEQNKILVRARPEPEHIDADGNVLLRPAGVPRVLTFVADDVEEALLAVKRFVAAVRPDYVRSIGASEVEIDGTRVLWRAEGEASSRVLRVVTLPADPYGFERRAARLAEALAEWAIVNGVDPRTMTSSSAQAAVVTSVHVPRAKAKMPSFEAAQEEFRARGLALTFEDVVQSQVVALARDAKGEVLWTFSWTEDQQLGTYSIRHYGDPFDTAGEQEILLAILRRSLNQDVRIQLSSFD